MLPSPYPKEKENERKARKRKEHVRIFYFMRGFQKEPDAEEVAENVEIIM